MSKKINFLFFLIFAIIIISLVVFDSLHQHWSAQWDLDFWYIYNASLMSSGIDQEWYDHPAVTFLTIFSISYKLLSIFSNSFFYKINEIIDSLNPDLIIQNLFITTRIVDVLNILLLIYFLFLVIQKFKIKNIYTYVLVSIVVFSTTFVKNLTIINPEDWAIMFFLITFYFFINYFILEKKYCLFLSGLFCLFSYFSKISILFTFIILFFLIPLFHEIYFEKFKKNDFIKNNFNKFFLIYIILLILYSIIQHFVFNNISMFDNKADLDTVIVIFINLSLIIFFLLVAKFDFNKFKLYFSSLLIFLSGFLFGIICFLILDVLNVSEFNPHILFKLTNPFNEMIRFTEIGGMLNQNVSSFDLILQFIKTLFSKFLFDKFLFFVFLLIFLFSILKDFKNSNFNYLFLKLIFFLILLINILIFNFRFFSEYLIYTYVLYVIILSICFENLSEKTIKIFCLILAIYVFVISPFNNFNEIKNHLIPGKSKMTEICEVSSEFKIYSKRFNESTYQKLCDIQNN